MPTGQLQPTLVQTPTALETPQLLKMVDLIHFGPDPHTVKPYRDEMRPRREKLGVALILSRSENLLRKNYNLMTMILPREVQKTLVGAHMMDPKLLSVTKGTKVSISVQVQIGKSQLSLTMISLGPLLEHSARG